MRDLGGGIFVDNYVFPHDEQSDALQRLRLFLTIPKAEKNEDGFRISGYETYASMPSSYAWEDGSLEFNSFYPPTIGPLPAERELEERVIDKLAEKHGSDLEHDIAIGYGLDVRLPLDSALLKRCEIKFSMATDEEVKILGRAMLPD